MALGFDFSGTQETGGSGSSTTVAPPSGVQQTTDFLNTIAWVAGGGLLLYLVWPALAHLRDQYRGSRGDGYDDGYEPRGPGGSGGRRGRYATTEHDDDAYDAFRTAPRSRRRVSVQFEE